ncbi:MAG TPA: YtxH domain-containing protein [bacterium]
MSRTSDTLLAFLLGAVAGGVTALLTAPERGADTRRRLRREAADLYGRGEELLEHSREALEGKTNEYVGAANEMAEEVRTSARRHASAVREAAHQAKEAYRRELEQTGKAAS